MLFLKQHIFFLQSLQTANTKAIIKPRFYINPFLYRQLYSIALAQGNTACLTFKYGIAAWAIFVFVFTHMFILPVKSNASIYHKRNTVITQQIKEFFIGYVLCIGKKFQMAF
jgi:hypothetical protein